jgi:hypothetical protein
VKWIVVEPQQPGATVAYKTTYRIEMLTSAESAIRANGSN